RASADVPLAKIVACTDEDAWYRIASGKGVLLLHALRERLGDDAFEKAMRTFGEENAGKKGTASQFQGHVEKSSGKALGEFFKQWLQRPGLPSPHQHGGVFHVLSFLAEIDQTLIVYGTLDEVPTNREAAESLQQAIRERGSNFTVPIKADKDVTEGELRSHHLLLVGRPGSNAVVGRF